MNREELLAAVTAERLDCRWFPTPPKTARDINVPRDDEITTARRRRALVGDAEFVHRRGNHVWRSDYRSAGIPAQTRDSEATA